MECLTSILQEQVGAELVNFWCQKKFFLRKKRLGKYCSTGGNKLKSLNFCWAFPEILMTTKMCMDQS